MLAWNAAWAAVAAARPARRTAGDRPNLARFVFTHPAARVGPPEWRAAADEQAGRLRRAASRWGARGRASTTLVDELRIEPEFEVRWNAHPIGEKRRGAKRLAHPLVGDLDLTYEVLDLADDTDQQLVTWMAADDVTAARLATLTGHRAFVSSKFLSRRRHRRAARRWSMDQGPAPAHTRYSAATSNAEPRPTW